MKTVKDFRDAGLVINSHDQVDSVTRDPGSLPVKVSEVTDCGSSPRDAWTIARFAFRAGSDAAKVKCNGWANRNSRRKRGLGRNVQIICRVAEHHR